MPSTQDFEIEDEKPETCPNCGNEVTNSMECENCGALLSGDDEFSDFDVDDDLEDI